MTADVLARQRFAEHLRQRNGTALRTACVLAFTLVPLFLILDYVVMPEFFTLLLAVRTACTCYAVGVFALSFSRAGVRYSAPLSISLLIVLGMAIVFMVHLHDIQTGHGPSHYYAGVNLVVLAGGILFRWTKSQAILAFSVVYLTYLVPSLLLGTVHDNALFLSNNFFLLSTFIVVTFSQAYSLALEQREFHGALELTEANKALAGANQKLAEANQQFEDANRKLKEMDRYKTNFFSNITHELKTPLTLIHAPVESMLDGDLGSWDRAQLEMLRGVQRNSLRLLRLINDLLDLSKLEAARLRLRIEETDLATYLGSIVDSIEHLAVRKELALRVEVIGEDTTVWIDHHRFERVVINLLANATKFTPEGGEIVVKLDGSGPGVEMTVQDSGIGIPDDKLEFIFDRFSQVDSSTTRKYGGTGLGLALVRELVGLHGGTIHAESAVGIGTAMHVHLERGRQHFAADALDRRQRSADVSRPKRAEDGGVADWSVEVEKRDSYRLMDLDDVTERRLVVRTPPTDTRAKKVLVVEDNRDMLQLIHVQLSKDYNVFVAPDGRKGLELVQRERPDLVVTDWMMPEMDGRQLCAAIKNDPETRNTPVVMLTARSAVEDRLTGRDAGADEYLAKPFNARELLTVVRGLLRTRTWHTEATVNHELDAMSLLSGRIAHEIKNPLNLVKNGAEIAARAFYELAEIQEAAGAYDDPEAAARVAKLQNRMERMTGMVIEGVARVTNVVDLLREYTREGYRRIEQPYDLREATSKAIPMVMIPVDAEVGIHTQLEDAGPISCVPQEMHEVVFNLIQNAVDATQPDGNVQVATYRRGDWAVLTVSDDGPGIPPADQEKIFSPFFTSREGEGGMGLGLSITRQLVRKVGGVVNVSSELGRGASFEICIPIVGTRTDPNVVLPNP